VTVQLPVRNERAVVERLLEAVVLLDWPVLQIQVLDDSDPDDETGALIDRAVVRLREAGHVIEVLRRGDRAGFKAGNLQHGLRSARGEFLLVLDADSVPSPSLVRELMAPMSDARVGFSQARWGFLNRAESVLTRVAALILDGHFVAQARDSERGHTVQLNGTSCLVRRSALEAAGGWLPETEASVTEDLDLSARMWALGFRGVTLADVSVETELPSTMGDYRTQQARWLRGAGEVVRGAWLRRASFGAVVSLLLRQVRQPAMVVLLLTAPLRLWAQPATVAMYAWPLALGLLWLGAGAYYATASRRIGRGVVEPVLLVPVLVVLSLGLSLALTWALLEGLFSSRAGEFIRTAKRGDGSATYKTRRKPAFVELAVGLGLAACAGFMIYRGQVPLGLGFLSLGPLWVGLRT